MVRQHPVVYRLIIALGLITVLAGVSHSQLVLYDDFSTAMIGPDKWHGYESTSRRANPVTDAGRFIESGKLRVMATAYGGTDSNRKRRSGAFGLAVTKPKRITAIQAEVTVTDAVVSDCPENALSSRSRAQLIGFFFNDGTSRRPGDMTGNVLAEIEKMVDSRAGNVIRALVVKCTSPVCASGELIGNIVTFKTPMTFKQPDILRIEWDATGEQFIFSVNPDTQTAEVKRVSYAGIVANHKPPDFEFERLRAQNQGANCTSGRRVAFIDALFDDVHIRRAASPEQTAQTSSMQGGYEYPY